MPQRPLTSTTIQGERALRRSSHDDSEPGLEIVRWGSILGGSALMAYGLLRRRRLMGLFYAGIGAAVAYKGLKKNDVINRSLKRLALHTGATEPVELATSMTIERPVEEVYKFWRNLQNLPRFLRHIDSIDEIDDQHSRWTARLPGDVHLEWRAKLVEETPNEVLAWQSVQGSDIFNEGYLTFESVFNGQGTELHARIVYRPPAGEVGARIANFLEVVQEQFLKEDLRSFKQLMETGELATIHGQPSARKKRGNGRIERMMP